MKHTFYSLPALLTVSLFTISGCGQSSNHIKQQSLRPVQAIKLSTLQKNKRHQFTGKLKSAESADIAFRVPGLIEEILVNPGDRVTKGQVLARLDPHDYQVNKRELEARLMEAKAAHKLADIELKRVKQALDDDAISSISLDRAQSSYERSKAMVEVVKQNLQRANDAIRYTKLLAPFTGVIGKTNFDKFEQVVSGIAVFNLHRPDQLEVEINVPENLISHFQKATEAEVSWYQAENTIKARQLEIETQPDPIKQTYSVTYQLDSSNIDFAQALPGKSVTLSTLFNQANNDFCLPYSALMGEQKQHYVFTVDKNRAGENKVTRKKVTIAALKDNTACVAGELNPSDLVVVAGTHYLKNGDSVGNVQIRNNQG